MKQPNILLFCTDDHGAWANGCYGNSEVHSPNLDRLAKEGVLFANTFTPCPVSSPARACLYTGRTPSQVGIHDYLGNAARAQSWLRDENTLFELLQAQKYFCGLVGKWHMGDEGAVPAGIDWHVGLRRAAGGRFDKQEHEQRIKRTSPYGKQTQFFTESALLFLDEAPRDKPFFVSVNFMTTHSPYANQEPDLVALYDNATFGDIPKYVPHPWRRNEGLVQANYVNNNLREHYSNYYAAVTDIDRSVGQLMTKLEEQGRLDNTIIIYTGDHGCALGHHGFWGKGNSTRPYNMYETSLRVPLIWRCPQLIESGKVCESNVDHYDTFQTLCELTGIELPEVIYPGRSYLPVLTGNEMQWDDTTYGEYGDLRMIRTPRWKLVYRYPNGPHDLFDLQHDPQEKTNLADNPKYADKQKVLLERLEQWYSRYEDPQKSGLRVKQLPVHNPKEAWRDGAREARGLQVYGESESAVAGK